MDRLKAFTVLLCLFLMVLNFSQLIFVSAFPSYATGYNPLGSTTHVSGSLSNLQASDENYMVFRSYVSSFNPKDLYAHIETIKLGEGAFYLLKPVGGDITMNGTVLSTSLSTAGRQLWGRFIYPLSGVVLIPASVWTFYYRGWVTNSSTVANCDVDLLIRKSDGTVRVVLFTQKATPPIGLTTTPQTLQGIYYWPDYSVVDKTDYFEVDYYCEIGRGANGLAFLSVDDSTLPTGSQTGIKNVLWPSEYTCEVELSGNAGADEWYNIVWAVEGHFTVPNVTATLSVYNWVTNTYSFGGSGYLTGDVGTVDILNTQTIEGNTAQFRSSNGNWKIKMKAVMPMTQPFDWYCDYLLFFPVGMGGAVVTSTTLVITRTLNATQTLTSTSTSTTVSKITLTTTSLVNVTNTSFSTTISSSTTVTSTVTTSKISTVSLNTTVTNTVSTSKTTTIMETAYATTTHYQTMGSLSTELQIILVILVVAIFVSFVIGFMMARRGKREDKIIDVKKEEEIEESEYRTP